MSTANNSKDLANWGFVKIKDIHSNRNETVLPYEYPDEKFEYYSIPSFQDNNKKPEIQNGREIKSNKLSVNNNDVLYGKLNPKKPKVWLVNSDKNYRKISSTEFLPISVNPKKVSSQFIYQYLLLDDFTKKMIDFAAGSTNSHQRVSPSSFYDCSIPLPPLPEQQKIAEILSTADDKIDIINQQINETQVLKKGLMQRLYTKGISHTEFKDSPLGEIPESWNVVKFDDILQEGKGSLGYGILQPGEGVLEGINMVRTVDLTEVGRADTEILQVPESISNTSLSTILEGGEVLLSVMGTLGRTFVVPKAWKGWNVNRALAVIRTNERIDNYFLCHYFRSPHFKRVIEKQSLGSAQMRINLNDLRRYNIPLPSVDEQLEISKNLNLVDDKIEVLEGKKTCYQELKQGLMQQLLTGKLRVVT